MAQIYDEEVVSIYDGEEPSTQEPDSVTLPKAAYTVLASTPNTSDIGQRVAQTYRQSQSTGGSDLEKRVLDTAVDEFRKAKDQERVNVAVSNLTVEEKVKRIQEMDAYTFQPDMISETYINQAAQFNEKSVEDLEVIRARVAEQISLGTARKLLDDIKFREDIEELKAQTVIALAPATGLGMLGEFVEAVSPFVLPAAYAGVISDLFPEDAKIIKDFTLTGESMKFLRDKFQAMSPEDRDAYMPMLKESLLKQAGLVSDNGYVAYTMINEIFAEEISGKKSDDFDWDRMFNNLAGVLDFAVIFGAATRLTGKAIKMGTAGKVMGAVDMANPQAARELRALILSKADSADVAQAVGMTAEDVVTDLYPTFKGATTSVTPQGVVEDIVQLNTQLKKIEDDIAYGINYTQEEIAIMQQRVVDSYTQMNGSYNQSLSEFTVDVIEGKGFVVKAAIGPSDDVGFKGFAEAVDHFNKNFPEGTKVDFVTRQGGVVREVAPELLDELVEVGKTQMRTYTRKADAKRGATRGGYPDAELRQMDDGRWTWDKPQQEVWYRVTDEYDYNLSLLDENTILFGGATFDSGFISGGLKALLTDPATRFSRFIAKASSRASDFGQGVQGRMVGMLKDGFLTPLNRNQQLRVMDVIQDGSKHNTNYSVQDLIGRGLDTDEVKGYYTIRGVMDLEWSMNNKRVYNTLNRDGYQSVVNKEGGFNGFGKVLAKEEVPTVRGSIDVFDPSTNKIVKMTADEVDYLYENGGNVLKSKLAYGDDKQSVTYIVAGRDGKTQVRPLTRNPLAYRPGYITRFYDENYFVKIKQDKIVDGVRAESWSVVAAAPTNSDATRLVQQLAKDNPKASFEVFPDQKMVTGDRFNTEFDYLHRTGGIITGRRGDHLNGIAEAQAKVLDPVQSMLDSISYTAQRVSHDDVIAGFERRWVNTYGKQFNLTSIPDDLRMIRGNTPTAKGVSEAKDLAGYIQAMRGTQGEWGLKWRGVMAGVAESIENTLGGGRTVKSLGDYVRGFNPVKTLRGLTFNLLLATNPMRQLLLQTNQITFLAGIQPKYMLGGGLARDFTAFSAAAATRTRPQWGKTRAAIAKTLKMSEDDFEKLYDGFVRSGLPQSIDSHTFARDGLQELSSRITGTMAERVGRTVMNAVKAPMAITKRVGFDAGEWSNVAMSYLVSWKNWTEANPGRNWRTFAAIDDIATDARDFALNMTRSGELSYQKGALSLATQFLSYQHKVLLAMAGAITGKGNKAFAQLPRHQRIGMVVSQFLMYGADGFGSAVMVDKVIDALGLDVPEHAKPFIDGLIYEYMLNNAISAITGEETNIDFAGALAPASGMVGSFTDLTARLMTMDAPDLMLGASASMIGRVADSIRNVQIALQIPDLSNEETLKAVLQQGGQIFGGYSNYVRGQAMMKTGYYVSNSGQPLFETTYAEGFAKALFGINPEAMDDYYKILEATSGGFRSEGIVSKLGAINSTDIDDIAEEYYKRVTKIYRELAQAEMTGWDDLWVNQLEAKMALENTLFAVLPEDVSFAVRKRVDERVNRNINTTGVDDLINYITRVSLSGSASEDTIDHYLRLLDRSELPMSDEQRQDVRSLIEYLIEDRK
jgi:hypothetical protein